MRTKKSTLRCAMIVAGAALTAAPALAAVTFGPGSATWSWDADTNSTNGGKTVFAIAPPNSTLLPTPNNYQLNRTGSFAGSTATGKGSIGYTINSTTATFKLSGGTGAAQVDPGDANFTGETVTKVGFSGFFNITGSNFSPGSGYLNLVVGGVAGQNGYVRIGGDMQFRLNTSGGATLRPTINLPPDVFSGTASSSVTFSRTYSYSMPFSPSTLVDGQKIYVAGSFSFFSSNGDSPSDITPISLEAGGAPPTATLYAPSGGSIDWNNAASWAPPVGSFVEPGNDIPALPNAQGHRARIMNAGSGPRTLNITSPITIGSLDIDDDDAVTINGQPITFNAQNDGDEMATIHIGNTAGNGGHVINAPIAIRGSLAVNIEKTDAAFEAVDDLDLNSPITRVGTGGTLRALAVSGAGNVNLNAANQVQQTTVTGADVRANVNGAFGLGNAVANGGMLTMNVSNPLAGSGGVDVMAGGQAKLNIAPAASVLFSVAQDSIVSASGAVLNTLAVGVNLNIADGGVIGHETFDFNDPANNPVGIGGAGARFIFGLSNDFPNAPNTTVGSGSATPWVGIGGDRLTRTLGSSSLSNQSAVTIAGTGVIFSGESQFIMLAPLQSASPDADVDVAGFGSVMIENMNNPFAGSMIVRGDATMRVNGQLPAVQMVTVQADGKLGGDGVVGGSVIVANDGILSPGTGRTFDDRIGSLTTGNLTLNQNSVLEFDFGGETDYNDQLIVNGDLTLDGKLLIQQLQFFDPDIAPMALFTWTGTLIDNGLIVDDRSQEIGGRPAPDVFSIQIVNNGPGMGGGVFVMVPEPGSIAVAGLFAGAMFIRRRR